MMASPKPAFVTIALNRSSNECAAGVGRSLVAVHIARGVSLGVDADRLKRENQ
jgi:hypothetical protein